MYMPAARRLQFAGSRRSLHPCSTTTSRGFDQPVDVTDHVPSCCIRIPGAPRRYFCGFKRVNGFVRVAPSHRRCGSIPVHVCAHTINIPILHDVLRATATTPPVSARMMLLNTVGIILMRIAFISCVLMHTPHQRTCTCIPRSAPPGRRLCRQLVKTLPVLTEERTGQTTTWHNSLVTSRPQPRTLRAIEHRRSCRRQSHLQLNPPRDQR